MSNDKLPSKVTSEELKDLFLSLNKRLQKNLTEIRAVRQRLEEIHQVYEEDTEDRRFAEKVSANAQRAHARLGPKGLNLNAAYTTYPYKRIDPLSQD